MTTPTSTVEVERKLTVPASFRLADVMGALAALGDVTRAPRRTMTAVYYDTDDFRLARSRVTLRRRTGGSDSGWHLKLPPVDLNAEAREEVVLPLSAGRPGRVPHALAGRVVALTGGRALLPLATQKTRRTPYVVCTQSGAPGVEIVDDLVAITEGSQAGTEYREVEVEVIGSAELLEPVAAVLTAAGAEPSASQSKGIRALVGDATLPSLIEIGDRPRPKDPASAAVAHHLRTQVSAIIKQDQRLRRHLPDAVHQYRVAARRLRSVLKAFAPLVDDAWARELRSELGWIASVLSQSRDREVLEARLIDAVKALPPDVDAAAALVAIQRHLEAELAEANASIELAIASPRYGALMSGLHTAAVDPPTTTLASGKASDVLPPLAQASWNKLAKQGRRLHNELDGHDDHWHRTRITAKRARYTVEACVPVFGGPAKKFAKQLQYVTELLGEHQDAAIAAELVQQLAERSRGARTPFALGVLYAQQRSR
ncbi:MAG: CYTH and CHAD domain-containing protein, partial [Actinomycetia bacterium]|nr:CYTH and CHAD domain-containing protein [Actinomycetes bacterium]